MDELLEMTRKRFPEKTPEWHEVYVARLAWYVVNDGDMTDAPAYPESA